VSRMCENRISRCLAKLEYRKEWYVGRDLPVIRRTKLLLGRHEGKHGKVFLKVKEDGGGGMVLKKELCEREGS
jgi:hypothetical protein